VLAIVDREAAEELAHVFGDPQTVSEREKHEA
jgi:hypothetical protein